MQLLLLQGILAVLNPSARYRVAVVATMTRRTLAGYRSPCGCELRKQRRFIRNSMLSMMFGCGLWVAAIWLLFQWSDK